MVDHTSSEPIRLDWLDALKGVGIIAVVAGHVWTRGPLRDAIYLFHMPLFFLASGFTLRAIPAASLARRLATSLAVPFLIFSTILLSADFLIEHGRGMRPIFANFPHGVYAILLASESTRGPFTILWFIPCLIIARTIWNMLALRWSDSVAWQWPAAIVTILIAGMLWTDAHSPLGLRAVPGALACLWLGALWRRQAGVTLPHFAPLALWIVALLALVVLPPINMKQGDVGIPLLSLAGAFFVTLALAQLLCHIPGAVVAVLAHFGRMSLVIMYTHVAFIHYLAPYAPRAGLFMIALIASAMIDQIARRHSVSRRLLLGARV